MGNPATHKVVSGDTLSGLAKKYGLTVSAIKAMNGLKSDVIKIGQVLQLTKSTHTVVSGDTLSGLAKKYGTTVAALKAANGLKSDLIKVGQVLHLPTEEKEVTELYWSYGENQVRVDEVSRFYTDLNLHILTKGYKAGESVEAVIEYDIEDGMQQFTVVGVVKDNGIATIMNVFDGSEKILIGC